MRPPAAALCALAVLALTGCGPSAEEKFRDQKLAPVQRVLEQQKAQVAALLDVARLGRKRDARGVEAQVAALGQTVDRMAALQPPSSIAATFRRFVVANRTLVGALRRFAVRLGGHSRSRLTRASNQAQDVAGRVAQARDALYAQLR